MSNLLIPQFRSFALLPLFAISACSVSSIEGDEPTSQTESAYDTFANPTEHQLEFGEDSLAVLTADERFHAFDFEISTRSDIRVWTLPAGNPSPAVDTVMYLYKQNGRGWGKSLASSDNARQTVFSEITRNLDVGSYRVLVKGKNANVRGAFRVGFDCPQCLVTSSCVFGKSFRDVRLGLTVKVEKERTIDHVSQLSQLSEIEQRQLVDAMHASVHGDVTTAAEALERVDGNEVNLLHLWDATNARPFVAFEYGAGDNSFGRIYSLNSLDTVANIYDGELDSCIIGPGNGGRDCRASAECGGAYTCEGISEVTAIGKCVPTASIAGIGESCTADSSGLCGEGLSCAGLTRSDVGFCQPEWMTQTFSEWQGASIPDNSASGVTRVLDVRGLATVDTDVSLNAVIRHNRPADLRVTLTNPEGTEVVVFDGATGGTDVHLDGPVKGFSGDESVNGSWTLKVVDRKRGTAGSIERWGLRIGSRWD